VRLPVGGESVGIGVDGVVIIVVATTCGIDVKVVGRAIIIQQ